MANRTKNETNGSGPEPIRDTETKPDAGSVFGNDDLGRIQGILLGEHATRTEERIDTLEKALLGVIHDLRAEVTTELSALESRLAAETEARSAAVDEVSTLLKKESKARTSAGNAQRSSLDKAVERVTAGIDAVAATAATELESVRTELADQIEQTDADNRTAMVDRQRLAALFTSAAAELADT